MSQFIFILFCVYTILGSMFNFVLQEFSLVVTFRIFFSSTVDQVMLYLFSGGSVRSVKWDYSEDQAVRPPCSRCFPPPGHSGHPGRLPSCLMPPPAHMYGHLTGRVSAARTSLLFLKSQAALGIVPGTQINKCRDRECGRKEKDVNTAKLNSYSTTWRLFGLL